MLHYGSLYWPSEYVRTRTYPRLEGTLRTTAVVIGGGMSGVTCGYTFARAGIPAVLIEKNELASGSTSANTGLLQYCNDKTLSDFARDIGEEKAVLFYKACKHAAERLNRIAEGLLMDAEFKRRSSLYYASTPGEAPALRNEYEMLHKHGFDADWWEADQIGKVFPFQKAAAIVTQGDAEVNPHRLVKAMAEDAAAHGLDVREHTEMRKVEPAPGGYRVVTDAGEIFAEHVVYAVGYAPEAAGGRWIRPRFNRSYALATEPIDSFEDWHQRWLLWETARPYLYVRATEENRIVIGGLDESVREPVTTDRELDARAMRLLKELRMLFPELAPSIRYRWCATFAESEDGLPWLGEDPDRPGQHYCLGYGGNGTIYSQLGAEIIRDRIAGVSNPVADIVRPDRVAFSGARD